jgi:hypothetical protein
MSPQLLAMLRAIGRDTQRLASSPDPMGARYPRDYHRPYALLRLWRGPGARYYPFPPTNA